MFLLLFCLFAKLKRSNTRSFQDWLKVAAVGIFEVVIPFTLVIWAQQFLSGSMAAILMGTIPFFTLLLVSLTRVETATFSKFIAMLIGFAGLVILLAPDLAHAEALWHGFLPKLAVLAGALSFASALVVIKSLKRENAFILSRDAFMIGTCLMFFISLCQGSLRQLTFQTKAAVSAAVLGVICSGLVYVLYVALIKRAGASFCSLSNYLVPLFGSLLGVLIMHDTITFNMMLACCLILLAIAIEPLIAYFR